MGTDTARAVVLPGDGLVARYPGILCVARCPDPATLHRLLEICRAAAGPDPGRPLARRLAMWLGGSDAPPHGLDFGTVASTGDATAVFLSGAVRARVGDTVLTGADAAAWTDRLVPHRGGPVRLALDGAANGSGPVTELLDLRGGVVAGGGVELVSSSVASSAGPEPAVVAGARHGVPRIEDVPNINAEPTLTDAEPVPDPAADEPPIPAAVPSAADPPAADPPAADPPNLGKSGPGRDPEDTGPIPSAAQAARPPRRSDAIIGVAPAEPPRAPLDAGEPVGTGSRSTAAPNPTTGVPVTPREGEARGHLCSRGHLNDPRSHFCVLCGIRMNERTGVLVIGARPPLGLLVFDDGATYTVDAEYLVGRMPESDERVRSGTLRSIVVEDRSGAVSRVHAEVRVDGWDVVLVDSGSRNGTFVAAPGDPAWTPVPARQSRRLVPGTRVRLGGRTFVFESPSGVR
ncbi:FHA domain-containing protein [Pseudonocardia sp.]|uniref:FHA domain-containing protein n=1 Tax=Pseudonocardia sp. TaxID=60912 RepID=UPI00262F279C|nr:FHA domain-containing protein [Pseudonocardia sp.]